MQAVRENARPAACKWSLAQHPPTLTAAMSDEQRTKRSAKKPAWMNDEMLIDPAEVEA